MPQNTEAVRVIPGSGSYGRGQIISEKIDDKLDPIYDEGLGYWSEVFLPKPGWTGNWADVLKTIGGVGAFSGILVWLVGQPYWLLAVVLGIFATSVYGYWAMTILEAIPNGWLWVGVRIALSSVALIIMFL